MFAVIMLFVLVDIVVTVLLSFVVDRLLLALLTATHKQSVRQP